jgi:prophage regulatory protein
MPSDMSFSISTRLEALATALTATGAGALASEAAQLANLVRDTDDLLRLDEVKRRTGLSTSEIYRREAAGEFPTPRKIGMRVVAWYSSDVSAWIKSRPMRVPSVGRL